ncbi:DUF433 domain-containing protein [Anabaena lutea FACHB-196]|uniref:DUF433 domain-containing protein n=2 Tax=Anabaena TaxID=1163 RepID=A0ABR8FNT5_9NOST|nr:DUF433 domain-containing protein [Anabaena lutea]MBD2571337.1 DUF433 domain-containing protein [Anabaena lutea FACHB-196]
MNELLTRITQIPGQCGGRPCIVNEILEDFPDLEIEDIQACLIFAARRTDFVRLTA